jgi:hypothetical protein
MMIGANINSIEITAVCSHEQLFTVLWLVNNIAMAVLLINKYCGLYHATCNGDRKREKVDTE